MNQSLLDFNRDVLSRALALLPGKMDSAASRLMLLAIALQESGCTSRCQVLSDGGRGPARGLWQFERGGGVKGVLTHSASQRLANDICQERCQAIAYGPVWSALETDDILACVLARLLLWTDPKPLPRVDDIYGSWALYERVWRPGKPHPERWAANHQAARETLWV